MDLATFWTQRTGSQPLSPRERPKNQRAKSCLDLPPGWPTKFATEPGSFFGRQSKPKRRVSEACSKDSLLARRENGRTSLKSKPQKTRGWSIQGMTNEEAEGSWLRREGAWGKGDGEKVQGPRSCTGVANLQASPGSKGHPADTSRCPAGGSMVLPCPSQLSLN